MRKKVQLVAFTLLILQAVYCQDILKAKTIDSTHNSVVAILRIDSAGNILVFASGVLINPRVVLTAGHVNFSNGKNFPGGCRNKGLISVSNSALAANRRFAFDWARDVESHPDTAGFIRSFSDTTGKIKPTMFIDLGLIFLNDPIEGIPIAGLPQANMLKSIPKNASFLGVGYGYNRLMDPAFQFSFIDGMRRNWKPDAVSLLNDLWLYSNCDTVTRQQFMNICDSGAPLLLNNETIVGTWSMSGPYPYPGMAVRIDNPKVLEWIRDCVKRRLGTVL